MNLEIVQVRLTELRLNWIGVQQEEIGDTTRYVFDWDISDICFARRVDETQPYTARDFLNGYSQTQLYYVTPQYLVLLAA
jgi:hypothetical protein